MLFSSDIFLFAFLPGVIAVYYLLRPFLMAKNIFLLLASIFFYAFGEPRFVLVMLASVAVNYGLGLLAEKRRRTVIALALIFNIGVLFIFKYLVFVMENAGALLSVNWNIPVIELPIGISFFTFQALSYVFDVCRGHTAAQRNPLYLGLYISLFPQLIAGPIVRYETVAEQITKRKESLSLFCSGTVRFIAGLSKKVILANNLAIIADKAFNMPPGELSVAMSWLGIVCYSMQIFFDFSGYSDMAIGLGRMFGFKFLENFNYPYIAKSAAEFWRRWHISLGSWFRDYVYIPLGGSRRGPVRNILNLGAVWLLTGIWHGANWTFVIWGMMYFVLLAFERLTGFERWHTAFRPLKHLYLLMAVMIGWVFFRAADLPAAITYLTTMFFSDGNLHINSTFVLFFGDNLFYIIAGILCSTPLFGWAYKKAREARPLVLILPFGRALFYGAALFITISFLIKDSYNPFIYYNF